MPAPGDLAQDNELNTVVESLAKMKDAKLVLWLVNQLEDSSIELQEVRDQITEKVVSESESDPEKIPVEDDLSNI
jgi:hypothetical protein